MAAIDSLFNDGVHSQQTGDLYRAARYYQIVIAVSPDHQGANANLRYVAHVAVTELQAHVQSGRFDLALGRAILLIDIGGEFLEYALPLLRQLPPDQFPPSVTALALARIIAAQPGFAGVMSVLRSLPAAEIGPDALRTAIAFLDARVPAAEANHLLSLCAASPDLLAAALDKLPETPDATQLAYRGTACLHRRQLTEARRYYRAALALDPDHVPAARQLARLHAGGALERRLMRRLAPRLLADEAGRDIALGQMIKVGLIDEAVAAMTANLATEPHHARYLRLHAFLSEKTDLARPPLRPPAPADPAPGSPAAPAPPVLVNLVVWGRSYVEMALRIGLPALLQAGNLPALAAERPVVLEIVTDAEGAAVLDASPIIARLREICTVSPILLDEEFKSFPDIYGVSGHYVVFGMAQHLTALRARAAGGDVLFAWPDVIFAADTLTVMMARLREGAVDGILADGLNTNLEDMLPLLEKHRSADGTVLSVDAESLAGYALANLHARALQQIVADPAKCSSFPSRLLFGKPDGLSSRAFSSAPLVLTNRALRHLTAPDHLTTDGRMVEQIFHPRTGMRFHVAAEAQELLLIELSPRAARTDRYAESGSAADGILNWLMAYGASETTLLSFQRPTRFRTRHPVSLPVVDDETEAAFVRGVTDRVEQSGLYSWSESEDATLPAD